MVFREISFGSAQYEQECVLRDEILRQPLGLSLYDEDLALEKDQWHFGLFDSGDNLRGCVITVPVSPSEVKLRQMAVVADCQGRGHGRRILGELEKELVLRRITRVQLHARILAVGFYEKQGYVASGAEFIEVTIPHVRMDKEIG